MLAPVLLGTASPPGGEGPAPEARPERIAAAAVLVPVPAQDALAVDLLFAPETIVPAQAPPPVPAPAPPSPAAAPTPAPPPPAAAAEPRRPDVRVLVSLPEQKLYAFRGDEMLMSSPVSTGKRGHETPAGTFPILQKKVHHRSSTYDNAPMPYMQRLTWKGVALHAGALPGYPASHGCIRLPRAAAKKLFRLTSHDSTVTITHRKAASAEDALALLAG